MLRVKRAYSICSAALVLQCHTLLTERSLTYTQICRYVLLLLNQWSTWLWLLLAHFVCHYYHMFFVGVPIQLLWQLAWHAKCRNH